MVRSPVRLLIVALLAGIFLTACGGSDEQDIREWMKEQSKDLRGRVPDLPQIKALPVLTYEPGDIAAPFSPDKVFADDLKAGARNIVSGGPKDINPDAYPMTKYPLETMRLVGTIYVGKELRALVVSEREPVRQVRVGDYIGQNHGQIKSIMPATDDDQGSILLKEILLDKGVWIERETRFPSQEKGDKK